MFTKINVLGIIKDQHRALADYRTEKVEFREIFTFYLLPALIAAPLIVTNTYLNNDGVNTIITILSIFVALLLNVIVIIFDIIKEDEAGASEIKKKLRLKLLREVFASSSFCILVSIAAILFALLSRIDHCITKLIFNWGTYWCLGVFLLNLLMIIKRLYGLLDVEFRDSLKE